jgi:hypothetical protein
MASSLTWRLEQANKNCIALDPEGHASTLPFFLCFYHGFHLGNDWDSEY